ncbi:LysE family translocator [Oceanomicrobium pacificus]|uniref:LysE family transporter n=1 Tax=Oceanomicrobium pacificus TaxID=2692916 RepID=A0A6B0TUL2_9RHOB|nr:LysE family translocator [Oceanomicrobium pacificus]MXU64932.1 LysE family transporter [Oceanomicrobium pacificus]
MTALSLYLFIFAGLFSPGPNVILLLASGARFGFRATLPHVLGVAAGVGVTAGLTGAGLAAILTGLPGLSRLLAIVAAGWILWLAWTLLRAARRTAPADARPFTFGQAVLFQWVNPKVWAVALAAASLAGGSDAPLAAGLHLGAAFACINLCVCLFYANAGQWLRRFLESERSWRIFMSVMAGLLALSALLVFV